MLRLYNPNVSQWLQTPPERVEFAENRAEDAENRALQEAAARQNAETALAEALEELERLKAEGNN